MGCLLGGALGDAWGVPSEGSSGRLAFQTPQRSVVSDDAQLTFATCETIIENGCIRPEQLASNFAKWFVAARIRGIGSNTLKAMRDLAAEVHWAWPEARESILGRVPR